MMRTISIALSLALSTQVTAQTQSQSRADRAGADAARISPLTAQRTLLQAEPGLLQASHAAMSVSHLDMQLSQARTELGRAGVALSLAGGMDIPIVSFRQLETQLPPLMKDGARQQEGAETLWRQAREELNKQNYRRAAELFERFSERFNGSSYAPDAYYWQAFALYRVNGTDDLEDAKALLERQRSRYPRASTRGQADQLLVQIRSQLAQRGDAGDAEIITREATRALQQGCPRDDEDDLRSTALNALLQMDAQNAMPVLKKIMARRDNCAAPLRRRAVFMVSQQRTTEREDILLDAARNDTDREVREQAVFWLGQVNTERALAAIEDVLINTRDRAVQEKAIFALSQHRSPRASQILRTWAEGDNRPADLRKNAIFWLGQQRDPENGKFLRGLYSRLPAGELKEQAIFALSQRRGEGNERWLMEIAVDEQEDVEMRKKAIFWAGQSRGTPIQEFTSMYDRVKSQEIKEQLIFALSQRRETAAVDKLLDIARKESNRELQKKAIFWLGQSKDPRVPALLLQIIG